MSIIVPLKIKGRLTGYDELTREVIRSEDINVRFDLGKADEHFPRFMSAMNQGKDKVAPAYNLVMGLVVAEDRDLLAGRLDGDKAAVMPVLGELMEMIVPEVEKAEKKSSNASTTLKTVG